MQTTVKVRFSTSYKTHLPTYRITLQGIRYIDLNRLQNTFANISHMLQGSSMSHNYLQNTFANIGNMLTRARANTNELSTHDKLKLLVKTPLNSTATYTSNPVYQPNTETGKRLGTHP